MLCATVPSHADFKYTESSKMTGGAVMGAMKFAGVFSKQARESNSPQISTKALKGNRLRDETADGKVSIIDLDGKRFINIDPKAKTYTILTFEQMKQQMLAAQERAKAEQAKEEAKHPGKAGDPKANLKLTPKVESSETGATRDILGFTAKEMKIRIEMLMETTDPKAQGQQISSVMDTDSWIAPGVPGYDELKQFYIKMAKQMDWVPGTVMGGMANSNIQVSMAELKKSNTKIEGFPLLQTVVMTLGGSALTSASANASAQQSAPTAQAPPPPPAQTQEPTSAKDAITQGIAGHFGLGGFGKKKKKADDPPPADSTQTANGTAGTANPAQAPTPASTPGSLMEMAIEVTSYSADPLDKSLFEVPAGYTEVKQTQQ
jgi:hypothetical protein